MEAFGKWSRLAKTLYEEHRQLVDKSMIDQLLNCIKNAHNYVRNYYKYSLSFSSPILSHNLTFCLGDPETVNSGEYTNISSTHEHPKDQCFQCENIRKTFKALIHLLRSLQDHMDDLLYQERKKEIQDGYQHICSYQFHLMRAKCQSDAWESLHDDNGKSVMIVQESIVES